MLPVNNQPIGPNRANILFCFFLQHVIRVTGPVAWGLIKWKGVGPLVQVVCLLGLEECICKTREMDPYFATTLTVSYYCWGDTAPLEMQGFMQRLTHKVRATFSKGEGRFGNIDKCFNFEKIQLLKPILQ